MVQYNCSKNTVKNKKRRTKNEVNGTDLEIFETREMAETPGTRFLSALSKERKKQVVVVSDVPIEKKYSMTVDKFIENAELEEVQED